MLYIPVLLLLLLNTLSFILPVMGSSYICTEYTGLHAQSHTTSNYTTTVVIQVNKRNHYLNNTALNRILGMYAQGCMTGR